MNSLQSEYSDTERATLAIGFAGWKGWLCADTSEAQQRLEREYERYAIAPSPEINSGVLILSSGSERPRLRIVSRGVVCDFSQMLAGPEWKRFVEVPSSSGQVYSDTVLGSRNALEVVDQDIVILQPERWPLYTYLAAMWLMLHEHPMLGIHAAVFAIEGHAFVLAGPSGSGKSTLSWAMHQCGADYFGDDWVFFTVPDYLLHIGHQELCMRPGGVEMLQMPLTSQTWYEAKPNDVKCNVPLPEAANPCPQDRVSLLFTDGFVATPQLREVGGGEAIRRLIQSMSYGDPAPLARLEVAAGFVNRYPCFALKVGHPKDTAALLIEYARSKP